ncbi:hypothetical protein [Pseudomonas oryzihabitans]|uniref:hypothetical protein n=1 Tax=Pseudomonas oryzihabitans TaxID=47885 RepID=UPI0011A2159A|nr:hypothetical protein [Pseudomonas oryzihabitans]
MDHIERAERARDSIRREIDAIHTAIEPSIVKARADAKIELASDQLLISSREWLLFMNQADTLYRGRVFGSAAA